MRIEKLPEGYVVVRGEGRNKSFFSFFVDSDSSSWSKNVWNSRKHKTENDAADAIVDLKKRVKARADVSRKEGK